MKLQVQKLVPGKGFYPSQLRDIPTPPKQLFWLGAPPEELLKRPLVSIVGSRKVSPYGKVVTEQLAGDLARQGVVIVSGLALGVDSIAHAATLKVNGLTIAILPCGLDRIYPSSHHHLAKEILENGGALVTEYREGEEIYESNFVARNRIVSGLSRGVLITEAAAKSGTLHTANFALEQGREVFAVPGNITSQTSVGTNNLIKAGAHPVTEADDILSVLKIKAKPISELEIFADSEEETVILKLVASGVHDSDALLKDSGLPLDSFNQTLTMLEITGKIRSEGAGHWTLS
ncbi:MAG TPA: DNA-processing protein DprA [Candidatus Saccharimonadales bacterium]|nr:DNA-processing protein DprA [Candidatus Saccharimonadales bacterium]